MSNNGDSGRIAKHSQFSESKSKNCELFWIGLEGQTERNSIQTADHKFTQVLERMKEREQFAKKKIERLKKVKKFREDKYDIYFGNS